MPNMFSPHQNRKLPNKYHSLRRQLYLWVFLCTPFGINAQNITGTVFRDFNANGVKDNSATYNEVGVGGVTVSCTDSAGNIGTTTTSSTLATLGQYTLTGCTAATRVEFTWTTTSDYSAPVGTGSNTSVQFINATRTNVNFGINYFDDYWDSTTNPRYVVPQYRNGLASANTTNYGLVSTLYNSTGLNSDYQNYAGGAGTGPKPNYDLFVPQIGSVWGSAYHKTQKHFYFTTFLKRHVGMADGPGYIYNVDYSSATPTVTGKFNLQGVTPSNGGSAIDLGTVNRTGTDNALSSDATDPNWDIDAFGKVGTMSFGDSDIQPGTDYLWTVNLFQKALIRIDVSGNPTSVPANVDQYLLANLPGYPTSSTGVLRPWALKFSHGKGYLGVINDASTTGNPSDLKAIVLEFDPNNIAAGFTQKLNFDPNPKRVASGGTFLLFKSWLNTYSESSSETALAVYISGDDRVRAQPVLSDIEFDEYDNMYISFFDRLGHQMGYWNYRPVSGSISTVRSLTYGEIDKACKTATGWEIEGTGTCHTSTAEFIQDISGDDERESSMGAVALLKGKQQLLQISIDPHPQGMTGPTYYTQQGVNTYNLTNGQIANWYAFYQNEEVQLFGKANGLGDIELVVPPAPIEIGNRVWLDTDNDGVQDAGEAGISGVQVQLLKGATVIGTVTTDTNGNYLFSNATGADATGKDYGITQLVPNMAYTVHFPTSTTVSGTSYNLTTANSTTGGGTDLIDSDAAAATGDVSVLTTDIPVSGANNHTFDVGYSAVTCTQPTFTINAVQPTCASPTGSITIGTITGPDTYTFNYDAMATYVTGVLGTNGTASNGATVASGLAAGTYTVQLFKSTDNTCISSPNQTITLNAATGCGGGGGQPDLELTKVADKATVVSGNTLTYTITLKNVGTANATGVVVKDMLPAGLTFSSASASQGSYSDTSGLWTVGTVAVGATLTLTITVTVN